LDTKLNIAIYPGSFDPVTNGHLDIIARSAKLFDRLIIGISKTSVSKSYLFSDKDRLKLLTNNTKHLNNVELVIFDGLLVDYAKKININVIIRGLRAFSDFESEIQMSLMNRKLDKDIDTIFLMPDEKYTHISSSIVKEVFSLKGDISDYVPDSVLIALKEKYEKS
jgi:pantetheine-phosphate adenylyltransferase